MADYSNWELVDNNSTKSIAPPSATGKYSGWESVQPEIPNSMQPQSNESLGLAAIKAPYRVAEDIYRGTAHLINNLPQYYQSAKSSIPAMVNSINQNPGQFAKQGLAGIAEMGQNIFNLPHDISNYATNRLNLIPQDINQKIQMARMPESSQEINATFGTPQNPGEEAIRWVGRNAINLLGGSGIAKTFNPLNLTAKSIANDVVNTEKQQIQSHSKRYNKIWDKADKSGFNNVPVNTQLLSNNLSLIEKYKTPKEYQSLEDFILNPTLENAQKAQSDMGIMHRKLEEKSRTGSLTSEENALYNAAKQSEKHIENNMFKNSSGKTNSSLLNDYKKVTKSYRENVVPYKYNNAIQAYKNQELLPHELVNALSRGEFAAKKGSKHPAIKIRNIFSSHPFMSGAGLMGAGLYGYDRLFGNQPENYQNQ